MRNLRLQRITTNYPAYIEQFYARNPDLGSQSYAVQHAALMADCYGGADFWSVALSRLGHETDEVVANAEAMQKRWAEEKGVTYCDADYLLKIAAAQVKAFQPDILFVNDYVTFTAAFLRQLKSECRSIRLILGWCGAPYNDPSVFREYNMVLTCIPEFVPQFREKGHRCYHINHAFEGRVLGRIDARSSPNVDFSFIGSIVKLDQFHNERERLLVDLVKATGLRIWSDVPRALPQEDRHITVRQWAYDAVQMAQRVGIPRTLLSAAPFVRKVTRWEARPSLSHNIDRRIARRARPPVFGLAMFQQLHDSRVALNTHIDASPVSASNMRLYEATGVGTCLLTDWKANLAELFEPDVEVVTYRNSKEAIEKVRYLLGHESERRAIAAAGQRRTLRDHTFDRRAEQLDAIIRENI